MVCLVSAWSASDLPALETDQYLALGVEISDATDPTNRRINAVIGSRLDRLNWNRSPARRRAMTCDDTVRHALRGFRWLYGTSITRWAQNDPDLERYPDRGVGKLEYYERSVLGQPFYSLFLPLGRTVNIDGVHLGVDKLGHFLSFGARYHRRFVRLRERGLDEEEALRRTIRWGIRFERTLLGSTSSGVLSFADLEANYQGLRLARSLCSDEGSARLVLEDDRWRLEGRIDLRDYVNPAWDEAFNPSVYTARRWKHVRRRIEQHCARLEEIPTVEQLRRYEHFYEPSFNEQLVRELEFKGELSPRSDYALISVCTAAKAR